MKRIIMITLAVLGAGSLTIVGGTTAFAHFGKGDHYERMIERIDDRLNLNDSQRDALEKMAGEARTFFHEKRRAHTKAMADLWRRESVNADEIAALMRSRHEMHDEERHRFIAAKVAEFHALLTPQQRTIMAEEMPRWIGKFGGSKRHGWGRQRGGHHGGGGGSHHGGWKHHGEHHNCPDGGDH